MSAYDKPSSKATVLESKYRGLQPYQQAYFLVKLYFNNILKIEFFIKNKRKHGASLQVLHILDKMTMTNGCKIWF